MRRGCLADAHGSGILVVHGGEGLESATMPPAPSRAHRHAEILSRWPVLNERWAQQVEAARPVSAVREVGPGAAGGISLLQAINRASGLPDDHGGDAIDRARAREGDT